MRNWPDESGLRGEIKRLEEEGDRITHDILHQLYTHHRDPARPRGHPRPGRRARRRGRLHRGGRRRARASTRSRRRWSRRVELTGVLRDAGRELGRGARQAREADRGGPAPDRGRPPRGRRRPHQPPGAGRAVRRRDRPDHGSLPASITRP